MTFITTVASEKAASVATSVGIKPKELKRFLKFAVVGVIGAIVDFGTLNLLLNPVTNWAMADSLLHSLHVLLFNPDLDVAQITKLGALITQSISFVLAICSNFLWNRYWTYPDSRSKRFRKQFTQFFVVNVSGLLPRSIIVWLSTPLFVKLGTAFIPSLDVHRFSVNLAVMLAVGIVLFWNFFANRYWTYNDVE